MTVRELREKLRGWPQDAPVAVEVPEPHALADARPVTGVTYWAAYDTCFVVIG